MPGFGKLAKSGRRLLGDKLTLKGTEALRHRRASADRDLRIGDATIIAAHQIDRHHGDGDHEIMPGAELGESRDGGPLGPLGRHDDGGQDFVRPERRAPVAEDEVAQWKPSQALRRDELDFSLERQQWRHAIRGRRGIAQISANRRAVLDLD
jgi:hypothetical protein